MLFQGEFRHSLDSKNRIVLPAAFRRELPEDDTRRFVVTIGRRAQWLGLYTREAWLKRVAALYEKYDADNEEDEKFLRDTFSSAYDLDLDAQFRFVLPKERREQVGVGKDLVFVGMGRYIEIWAEDRYDWYRAQRAGKQEPPGGKT